MTISAQFGLIDQETFFNKKVASKDLSNYFLVKNGEFAYNKSYSNGYPFGTIKSLKKYNMGVLSSLYIVFDIKKNNNHLFFDSFFDSSHWYKEVSTKTTEGARNHGLLNISPQEFMNIRILFPYNISEQKKIGDFFAKQDKLIELQTQKVDQLKKLKRGYLQKMFPQEGETVPRLRFSGFSGEWKEDRGNKIFYSFSEKNHEDLKPLSVTQNQDVLYRDYLDPALSYDINKLSTYKMVEKNDVIIGLRSFIGGFAISDKKGIVSPAYTILKFRDAVWDFYFTKYLFTNYVFIESLKKITYGIRVNGRSISYNDFSSLMLVYNDNIKEQQKIGEFFAKLDKLIEEQSNKLDQLKQQKKAYLQKMFI
ncbi:type I site-specific deoxyribonuclease specificity subunit [Apilactobacillus kunkeei DSM 12361 = ATCC 700308]|uniref:Type I site-specific deoxyribonuclease specificity subunit n=1 Tax=Apilactobacillus kunkeei DSM 12361 = ATCC 700308 TaxID=1423768 RepID=A0A0R1G2E5_9LACO|nr:type I site-specific deoxyribonuclease specificity subunit [Apilactobacillus kunkeei DSM 12361 = ATCC 700308]